MATKRSERGRQDTRHAPSPLRAGRAPSPLWRVMPALVAGVLAVVAFAPVLDGGDWVFDDHVLIERNRDLDRPDIWRRALSQDYYASSQDPGGSGYYRPLAVWLNALDRRGGRGARGAHQTNLLLHAAASMAVGPALLALGAPGAVAWMSAALFAVHPVHAESVAFVSGRVDVLATLFVLLALALAARTGRWVAPALGGAVLLALLGKEIAVVAPLLLVLVWRARASALPGTTRWPRAAILAVAAAFVVVAALRMHALGGLAPTSAHGGRGEDAALLPLGSVAFLLEALYAPVRRLAMEPDLASVWAPRLIAAVAIAAALWGGAWRWGGQRPFLRRALAVGLFAVLPVLNLLPQETALSERFFYLASAFLLVPLPVIVHAAWLRRAAGNRAGAPSKSPGPASARARPGWMRAVAGFAFVAVLALLLGVSTWRARLWRTDLDVWRQAVAEEPERGAFWDRLGLTHLEHRNYDDARQALRRAVALDPSNPNALANLGVLLQMSRDFAAAESLYRRAVTLAPRRVPARINLAQTLEAQGRLEDAYREYVQALAIQPEQVVALRAAARLAWVLGRRDEARVHLEHGLRAHPDDATLRKLQQKFAADAAAAP